MNRPDEPSEVQQALDALLSNPKLQKVQAETAARAISLYMHVLEGLEAIVPQEEIYRTAATLTAGIWASPD